MPAVDGSLLRVQLLGPVRAWRDVGAWRDGQDLDLGFPRQRTVLAILALRANQVVSREELVDGIWGDDPPAKAIGVLYTYISGLRRALEPSRETPTVLVSPGSGYSLRVAPHQVDEQQFNQHCETAQRYREHGEPHLAIGAIDAALSLWRGDALAGLSGPFAELHRARLGELRLTALERRANLKLNVGEHVDAIADLCGLVSEQPLREGPRALLMAALYRSGRRDEALEVFKDAQRVFVAELGIEPASAVQRIHRKILANQPLSAQDTDADGRMPRQPPERRTVLALPDSARPVVPPVFVGREQELRRLRPLLTTATDGRGGCGLVEGEAGIGKSTLLAVALADPLAAGCRIIWTVGNELAQPVPLRESSHAIDPRLAGVDRTLALVERLCAETPLVFVVDDLQRTDEAGLLVWRGLSRLTQQRSLVLLGACRMFPSTAELAQLRSAVSAVGGLTITVGPLGSGQVAELAAGRVGAPPGPALDELLDAAAGNPLYTNELLDTVVGSNALRTEAGFVDLDRTLRSDLEAELATMAVRRFGFLAPETREMLRWAALFGAEFDLADVSTVMHTSPANLISAVEEATAAGMLVDADEGFDFRDGSVRLALYEETPVAVRAALHRKAAERLADSGARLDKVAAQLLAIAPTFDRWTTRWLLTNVDALAGRDPVAAVDLLEHAVASTSIGDDERDMLAVRRVWWLFRLGRHPEAEANAVFATARNIEHIAAMRWILAHLAYRTGAVAKAVADLRDAEQDASMPAFWKTRFETLRAQFERAGLDNLDAASRTVVTALGHATYAADSESAAHALQELWYLATVRRDHTAALIHIDKALAAVASTPDLARRQLDLLDNRAFSLQNLDRLDEASETLARMRILSDRLRPPPGRHHVVTAVHFYWLGRWEDALAELDLVAEHEAGTEFFDLQQQARLLQHGVAALIAAHRGDTDALRSHLRAADAYPLVTVGDQENSDFLVVARAIDAGRRAGTGPDLPAMDVLLDMTYGRNTLRFQWLPRLVRLALEANDPARAGAAVEICTIEAAQETTTARAHRALSWCQALVDGDPAPLLAIARRCGEIGRRVERAAVLADAAAILAERNEIELARQTFGDAVAIFTELGASFDISRAAARMDKYGIRPGRARTVHPMGAGWHTLSSIEQRITELVAEGKPNPEIAERLTLSRRDVQSHISRILQKLGTDSRAELAEKISTAPVASRGDVRTAARDIE